MIPADYVWFTWASAFLVPWAALYWRFPLHRPAMRWASLFTMPFGLTEPLFVPEYWSPPSLLDLASRTGFDVESLIFSFAIGGVAAVLVNLATGRTLQEMPEEERHHWAHRWHRIAVVAPFLLFPILLPLGWNPIYPGILAMAAGAAMTYWCRRDLGGTIVMGAALFVGYYTVFLVGLHYTAPEGYIREVWNLAALRAGLVGFIPLEELLFAAAFGAYWSAVYQHLTWARAEDRHEGGAP